MKTFTKSSSEIVMIDTEAKKKADVCLKSSSQDHYNPINIKEDEDCAFGTLAFYLNNDKKTRARCKEFFKL